MGIYCNKYSQLATCICLSWIFTIFDWSMYILTDRWHQVNCLSDAILHQNVCCGYSLESPQRGDSNEYPQHTFLWRNKQIYPLIFTKYPPYVFHRNPKKVYKIDLPYCSSVFRQLGMGKQCRPGQIRKAAVWTGSTLFAILSSLNRVYTVCHYEQSEQALHCLPFWAVWTGSTLFTFWAVQTGSTLFAIL